MTVLTTGLHASLRSAHGSALICQSVPRQRTVLHFQERLGESSTSQPDLHWSWLMEGYFGCTTTQNKCMQQKTAAVLKCRGMPESLQSMQESLMDVGESSEKSWGWLQGDPRKVEAALLLPPFYFAKVTDAGLERWLRMVLEVARLPVFLYNFPDHTGNFISPDLFRRLAHDFPLLRGAHSCLHVRSAGRDALQSCWPRK